MHAPFPNLKHMDIILHMYNLFELSELQAI